jgi:Protein of unknown function (DUF2809)
MHTQPPRRSKFLYGLALLATVALGLASRKFPGLFPASLGKYPGDALWALMVFLLWAIILPGSSTQRLAAYALLTSYVDEFSQIYQAPWINGIRATTIGHLILWIRFLMVRHVCLYRWRGYWGAWRFVKAKRFELS